MFGNGQIIYLTLHNGRNYLSMSGLTLIHVSKRHPSQHTELSLWEDANSKDNDGLPTSQILSVNGHDMDTIIWYSLLSHNDGCWWLGAYLASGHLQPRRWRMPLDESAKCTLIMVYALTMITLWNRLTSFQFQLLIHFMADKCIKHEKVMGT